jgi:hypothetical protein
MEIAPPPTGNVISRYSEAKTVLKAGVGIASSAEHGNPNTPARFIGGVDTWKQTPPAP